jgi:microcystin-dependent protein
VNDEPVLSSADEPADSAFSELIAALGPVFAEVAKAAIAESIAAVPTTTYRPGVVQGISASERTASVLLDGDTSATTVQVLDQLPWTNARVMVKFVPPSAVFLDGIISASPLPAGTLAPYAGPITVHADAAAATPTSNQPPLGWLWCAGQAVSRSTYSALFAAIGTTYGAGDGSQTFNVPDLRGRVPVGLDNMGGSDAGRLSSSNTLGTTGGTEGHTLAESNLPSHSHGLNSHTHDLGSHTHSWSGTTNTTGSHQHSVSNVVASTQGVAAGSAYVGDINTTSINSSFAGDHSHTVSGTTGSASGNTGSASGNTTSVGSGSSVNHMQPFVSVHWLIKS